MKLQSALEMVLTGFVFPQLAYIYPRFASFLISLVSAVSEINMWLWGHL